MKAPAPLYDTEQRFMLGAMTLCVLVLLAAPTLDLMFGRDTWSYRLTIATAYPRVIPMGFVAAVGLLTPLLYCIRKRWAMRLACLGGSIGSFACFGMAYLGRTMEVGATITWYLNGFSFYFVAAGVVSLIYAAAIAVLLNSQMLHALTTGEPIQGG